MPMKENKNTRTIAAWILRISIPVYVYLTYGYYLKDGINLSDFRDLLVLAFAILAILLFFGAFSRKDGLTKISALLLIVVGIIALIKHFMLINLFFLLIVPIYFLIYGNRV